MRGCLVQYGAFLASKKIWGLRAAGGGKLDKRMLFVWLFHHKKQADEFIIPH